MQIHELNNFTGTLGAGAYLAIDDGTDTGKISSQGLLAATEARIDNIIAGPAPSAQEVTDARRGADGVTYSSLGTSIRSQVTDLKSELTDETNARILLAGRMTTAEGDIDTLETHKVAQPLDEYNQPTDGTDGQSLRTKGDGTTEWADVGLPTDAQTAQAVSDWLDDHPEATTTVQDGSLTKAKFAETLKLETINGYVTPQMFGAKGDGATDDTVAIQRALDSDESVFFPIGNYKVTDTLVVTTHKTIRGAHSYESYLTLATDGIPLLNLNNANSADSSLTVIENLGFRGIGKAQNQIGIDCKGWQIKLHNIDVREFKIGILLKGVSVYISESYLPSNKYGIKIEPQDGTNISTMINMDKVYMDSYDIGLWTENTNDVQSLRVTGCVFEYGGQAINLKANLLSYFEGNWLEGNTTASEIYGGSTVWLNNNTISDPAPTFTGTFPELFKADGGDVSMRYLKLTPSNFKLESDGAFLTVNKKKFLAKDILVIKDGTIVENTLTDVTATCTKNSDGDYEIKFSTSIWNAYPSVTSYNRMFVSDCVRTEANVRDIANPSYSEDYLTFDTIRVLCKDEANNLIKAVVVIEINYTEYTN